MNTTLHLARFTVAYWCVLIAALLPMGCAWLAKSGSFGKSRKDGGFDNHDPRAWMRSEGTRLNSSHLKLSRMPSSA